MAMHLDELAKEASAEAVALAGGGCTAAMAVRCTRSSSSTAAANGPVSPRWSTLSTAQSVP